MGASADVPSSRTVGRGSHGLCHPDATTEAYGYDADSHVTSLTYKHGTTTMGNWNYSRGSVGEPAELTPLCTERIVRLSLDRIE